MDRDALWHWGEDRVAALLRARGHLVTFTTDLPVENGHGPRTHGRGDDTLVPADLEVTVRPYGVPAVIQVKAKSHASMGRITGELEHGFPWRDWRAYLEHAARDRRALFIVIAEYDTRQILGRRIEYLRVRRDCPKLNHGQEMAYFPRSQFHADWIAQLERHAEGVVRPVKRRRAYDQTDLFE